MKYMVKTEKKRKGECDFGRRLRRGEEEGCWCVCLCSVGGSVGGEEEGCGGTILERLRIS